jgi:hypothetical protein
MQTMSRLAPLFGTQTGTHTSFTLVSHAAFQGIELALQSPVLSFVIPILAHENDNQYDDCNDDDTSKNTNADWPPAGLLPLTNSRLVSQ